MAGELVVQLWKEWGLQALVLLSFTLQVALLILAEFRRSVDSGVLRAFLWVAYTLADSTAIYVLGHMSVTSRSPEHQLMAFWAPFLLLHLGGQDSITAYAIEDNELWLRHLQTLAVQVVAVAYVLYESFVRGTAGLSSSLLMSATIIMFAVGVAKCGERVWAQKCAASISFRENRIEALAIGPFRGQGTERLLSIAHRCLAIPMGLLTWGLTYVDIPTSLSNAELYKVAEMQLFLMHDIFFTKVEVTHTWCGFCILVFSSLGTAVALALFLLLDLDDYYYHRGSRYSSGVVDLAITYVLLVGAVILEITSALRAMFSSWADVRLHRRYQFLARIVGSLRRLIRAADWRKAYWPRSIGQLNFLQLCAPSKCSKIARWLGAEGPWNTFAYSFSVPVSGIIREMVVSRVLQSDDGTPDSTPYHILNSRGRAALKNKSGKLYEDLRWSVDDLAFDESILVWHIATSIYLCWHKKQAKAGDGRQDDAQLRDLAEAAEGLSNYMHFLLVARPYMLPPPTSILPPPSSRRDWYVDLDKFPFQLMGRVPEDIANELQRFGTVIMDCKSQIPAHEDGSPHWFKTTYRASELGAMLTCDDTPPADMLKVIIQVWVEVLCYAAHRCSAHSHAKQLNNGGELITITAILMEYSRRRTSMRS